MASYVIGSLIVFGIIVWITENMSDVFGDRIFSYLPLKYHQSVGVPIVIALTVLTCLVLSFVAFGEKGQMVISIKIITYIMLMVISFFSSFFLVSFVYKLVSHHYKKDKIADESCLVAIISLVFYILIVIYIGKLLFG